MEKRSKIYSKQGARIFKIKGTLIVLASTVLLSVSFVALKPNPRYISIAFIQSQSPDFITHEKTYWVPIQKKLIKAGRKDAWYMYKVSASGIKTLPFDYIRFNVFHDLAQTINPYADIQQFVQQAYPDIDKSAEMKKTNSTRTVVWEQLYELKTKHARWVLHPVQAIQLLPTGHRPSSAGVVFLQAVNPINQQGLYLSLGLSKSNKSSASELSSEILYGDLVIEAAK